MLFSSEGRPDRRPTIVICAYDTEGETWDPFGDLSGEPWNPTGARTVLAPAEAPDKLIDALVERLHDPSCRAVFLVGRTRRPDKFRVQMRAENRATDGSRFSSTGPAMARATAPVAEMVRALKTAGLDAEACSDEDDDAGGFLLYRLLMALEDDIDVPAVGLMRAPANASAASIDIGVRAAATAMALHLSPLPRLST